MQQWVSGTLQQTFEKLNTNDDGLSENEATQLLQQYGPNLIPEKKQFRLLSRIFSQFKNLFNILLLVAALLSFITGISSNDASSIQMGFAIIIVVLISVIFNLFQEHRAERAVEAIRELVPATARVIRDGQTKQIPIVNIVPGDIISLEEGDKIPADARLVCCYQFSVDNSSLTGEAEPQPRSCDPIPETFNGQIIECSNLVFASTTASSGSATAVVFSTGPNTVFGKIVTMTQTIEEPPSPLQREINYTAKINFVVAIALGVLFLSIAFFILHLEIGDSLLFMIGVMVSLVPEGLQITVTLSLALSSLAMSRRNVVVKKLSSVETLGSTTVICSDKTGTITTGQMMVQKIWMADTIYNVSGEGFNPQGAVFNGNRRLSIGDQQDLLGFAKVAALDNKATLLPPVDQKKARWTALGDSTDAALLVFSGKAGIQYKQLVNSNPRVALIPFDSHRKMMTSIHKDEHGKTTAYVKGAGNEILSRCTRVQWKDQVLPMTSELQKKISDEIDFFARQTYRVIALAIRDLPADLKKFDSEAVENNLMFVGLAAIYDPPRRDVPLAVQKAQSAGIRIIMITGDHELTAEAIARKVGIITSKAYLIMTGYKLATISDDELDSALNTPDVVFARITPEQKLRIVRVLRKKGETVAVTGDGANDAPALLEADIGIAMGISGTDVARESADMILMDDNFASIVNGIEEGRSVFDNLKKFIVYVFTHNWAELATFIAFVLLRTPLPLAVVGVLLIDLVLEIPPSLALSLEPPEPGIMERQPRKREERLFSLPTLVRSGYVGFIVGVFALFWCFLVWMQGGWHFGELTLSNMAVYLHGTTIVLVGIMMGQLGMLLATRTNIKSTFSVRFRNRWLIGALIIEFAILLLVVYIPGIGPVLNITAIPWTDWVILLGIAPAVIVMEEVRKFILRHYVLVEKAPTLRHVTALPEFGELEIPKERKIPTPFVERAAPILFPVTSEPGEDDVAIIAMTYARNVGSRLVVLRVLSQELKTTVDYDMERYMRDYAADIDLPLDYIDIHDATQLSTTMLEMAKNVKAHMIISCIPQKILLAGSHAVTRSASWIDELPDTALILVGLAKKQAEKLQPPFRVLIPVLHSFENEPFEFAAALTSSSFIPDVNVIAAKVIEFPQNAPLYSLYNPEYIETRTLDFGLFRRAPIQALRRRITPLVLYVQDISRGIAKFVRQRKVQIIILTGDWSQEKNGFLAKRDRQIVQRVDCAVIVTLPARHP